jgi:hypothetical protein
MGARVREGVIKIKAFGLAPIGASSFAKNPSGLCW